jgi:hypothetical protein
MVSLTPHDKAIHEQQQQALEKRQGTKSREVSARRGSQAGRLRVPQTCTERAVHRYAASPFGGLIYVHGDQIALTSRGDAMPRVIEEADSVRANSSRPCSDKTIGF